MATGGDKTHSKVVNAYEQQRRMQIQANNEMLQSMGIKHLASSLTSLVESTKERKRKVKSKTTQEDDEYVLDDYPMDEERVKGPRLAISTRAMTGKIKEHKKGNFIPPMAMAKFLKMNKKHQEATTENGAMESVTKAIEIVEKAFSQHVNEGSDENVAHEEDIQYQDEERFVGNHIDAGIEKEKENEDGTTITDNMVISYDQHEQVAEGCISGTIRKTRGMVYCRKLTAFSPGEKINVDFDEDGNAIGPHSSLYAYFLGQQVRNRSVCPVQVKCWEEYSPEILDHLWACIKEKCSFDDPEYRKEGVLKHARRIFRDSRHKLKRNYFNDPKLKTKDERLKNKPEDMLKTDWKYLVDLWSDSKFQEKSNKARASRSCQKMPHYNGSKSYARLRQEIKKENGGKCSRLDVMVKSRLRKSKKSVNTENWAKNKHVMDEMNKLKEEREQGLNEKTDEQIFQDVLGKDTHGYLRAYGPGKSITKHFQVKPSRLDLAQEVIEVKKNAEQAVQEAKKDAENAKKEAEDARKDAEEARKDAEFAKNEVEATRNEVDRKIAANNKVWKNKLDQILQNFGLDTSDNHDTLSEDSSA